MFILLRGSCSVLRYDFAPHSNESTREPPQVISALSFIGGVHIGERALRVINLIWFGYFARLSQWKGGGNFLVHARLIY
jgi:hypothetical protein